MAENEYFCISKREEVFLTENGVISYLYPSRGVTKMFFKINSSNVNVYSSRLENIIENELSDLGYKRKTTFISDFGIAEWCGGCDAVKDTYNNAFKCWKNDIEYMTEFVMVINHLCWYHYYISKKFGKKYPYNLKLSELYGKLYEKADEYVMEHFNGDELHYYISTTD